METDLYGDPQPVQIDGYTGEQMEPCISLDGEYLFWNNSNNIPDTHIFYARRTGEGRFQYIGIVPGTAGPTREMAPSLDCAGHFYFTSQRTFAKDHKSIFTGQFKRQTTSAGLKTTGGRVDDVQAVAGDISPIAPFFINMDCGVSPDGTTLYLSRAHFFLGVIGPDSSYIICARQSATDKLRFEIDPHSDLILKSINAADKLQYAPTITADGLELYFTRADKFSLNVDAQKNHQAVRMMLARRSAPEQPFGSPETISAARGFVEAPSLTLDKQRLYFHQTVDKTSKIYMLRRKIEN